MDGSSVVAAYARWAPVYDRVFGMVIGGPIRTVVAEANKLPPSRILEVGVGTGIALPRYDRKHRIVGIDLSRDMLDRAEKRVSDSRLDNVEALAEMDAGNLTFTDESFDAVMAMFVITVVPDPQRVLSEIIRVVKPGGRVFLVNHFSTDKGPRASVERWLSRFSAKLGWRPEFPIDQVMGRPELKLIERRSVKIFDIFTMLVFERIAGPA
ncbi:MAG: methyltransferase domain-containing protein [Hyphomicrobiales bacterium]|nr:methyltransferase domain-containing protein [Hyphomicrobiales bacterium]